MSSVPIYLDHNATTPLDQRVWEQMVPFFCGQFANAASPHAAGRMARKAVEQARHQVAQLIDAAAEKIIFTSGATEANNLAIKGLVDRAGGKKHLIAQSTEHKAVLDVFKALERQGCPTTILPVDPQGQVRLEDLAAAIRPDTLLVSIMFANNEIGTIQPVEKIGELCRAAGVWFHCDATQAVGYVPVSLRRHHIDLLSCSAHKFYGPKGVGALALGERIRPAQLRGQMDGGGHERGLRSGTLNVPGIVGMGAAAQLAGELLAEQSPRLASLRDRLEAAILSQIPQVRRNGCPEHRLPQTSNLAFCAVEGESILLAMPDVAISTGSACTSERLEASHVLRAIGLEDLYLHGAVRYGVGRHTTEAQVDQVVAQTAAAIARLRELSPLWEMLAEGVDLASIQWREE